MLYLYIGPDQLAFPAISSSYLLLGPYLYDNIVSLVLLSKSHHHRIAAHNEPSDSRSSPADKAPTPDADVNIIIMTN